MVTLGEEIGYDDKWSPLSINLKLVKDTVAKAEHLREVEDADTADAFSKEVLSVADHLSNDLTRLRIYYSSSRSKAYDRLNDLKQSCIDEKSDAGKERVALCDPKFREMRDEYKKAELLVTHLEIKYKELISYHYSFKDTARRLGGLRQATSSGSDSERHDDFGAGNIPLPASEKPENKEPF